MEYKAGKPALANEEGQEIDLPQDKLFRPIPPEVRAILPTTLCYPYRHNKLPVKAPVTDTNTRLTTLQVPVT